MKLAKSVKIKKDGETETYNTVKKIHTHDADGHSTTWVPNDETQLMTKTVTENGTYKASDDDVYAYDKVVVNVSTKAVGKKDDDVSYVVEPNPSGGFIETPVPDSIQIITEPTKLTYGENEQIDLAGAVIKAYKGDNTLWDVTGYSGGIIPNNELIVNPRITAQNIQRYYGNGATNIIIYPIKSLILHSEEHYITFDRITDKIYTFDSLAVIYRYIKAEQGTFAAVEYNGTAHLSEQITQVYNSYWPEREGQIIDEKTKTVDYYVTDEYTADDKTVEYGSITGIYLEEIAGIDGSFTAHDFGASNGEAIWWGKYGTPVSSTENIQLSWKRPSDKKILSDNFTINYE